MKNRYPGACTTCKAQVLPGQGTLHRSNGRWNVTHTGSCPPTSLHGDQVRFLTKQTMNVLDNVESIPEQLTVAVYNLGRLTASGCLDVTSCRTRVMSSYAARTMDRLELEDLLDLHLPMDISKR